MTRSVASWLLARPRRARLLLVAAADATLLMISMLLGAYWRLGPQAWDTPLYVGFAAAGAGLGVLVFWRMGLYREILRYAGPRLLTRTGSGLAFVVLLMLAGSLLLLDERGWSREVLVGFVLLGTALCGGLRLVVAEAFGALRSESGPPGRGNPLVIYGVGATGVGLASALEHSPYYDVVAFIDDDHKLVGSRVRNLPVLPVSKLSTLRDQHPGCEVALAIPSATSMQRRRILDGLAPLGMRVLTVPGMKELVVGQAGVGELQELDPDDLLGREAVAPRQHLLARCVTGKSVMVTGAGGSIGSELCRQIARLGPARLLLLDHSEYALYQIEQELSELARRDQLVAQVAVRAVLGSVTSSVMVEEVLREHRVQTVYHAAAYKHVGLVEHNESAGVAVNTFGTQSMARAAIKARVESFVLVSTDKAVRPSSVMGASKRLAELILQDVSAGGWKEVLGGSAGGGGKEPMLGCPTRFAIVRFGNVLGSSGSVVPRFQRQIAAGGPVTVTHPEATRYFMTISEAVNLIIQAGSLGRGGEIYLLDMGTPIRILDLARSMIVLNRMTIRDEGNPAGDVEISFTGLQPGEKLNEELLVGGDPEATEHPKIRQARDRGLSGRSLNELLTRLESACDRHDSLEVRRLLEEMVEPSPKEPPVIEVGTSMRRKDPESETGADSPRGAPRPTLRPRPEVRDA